MARRQVRIRAKNPEDAREQANEIGRRRKWGSYDSIEPTSEIPSDGYKVYIAYWTT